MKSLSLALVCSLVLLPSMAGAQSYYGPSSYDGGNAAYPSMPQGPMPMAQGASGYGPMSQAGYGPMPQPGYGPPQGGYGPAPQGYGPMPQGDGQGMPPQGMGPQSGPSAEQMPQHTAIRAPKPKLPPGVTAKDGLLYYNGSPSADINYQNYPVRPAGYDQGAPMGPSRTSSVVSGQGGAYGGQQMTSGGGPMYSDGGMQGGGMGYSDDGGGCPDGSCGNGNPGCRPCDSAAFDVFGRARNCGNPYPGKMGFAWTAGFDALGMNRTAGTDRVLVQNTDNLATLLNSNEIHFDMTPGGRAFIQLMGPSGDSYQVVYMRLATFLGDVTVNGNNNLQIPFPLAGDLPDYFGADQMDFHYTSEIQGGEINFLRPVGNFQFIAGYRWIQLDESLLLRTFDNDVGTESDWATDAFNQMHYGQIGILGQWQAFGMLNFDFWAKFGVGGDICGEHQVIRTLDNSVVFRDIRGQDSGFTYCTELGLQAVLPLNSTFSLHGGYDVFILNRIALAPDQMDFNDTADAGTHVQQRGDLVLHGCNFGITAVW